MRHYSGNQFLALATACLLFVPSLNANIIDGTTVIRVAIAEIGKSDLDSNCAEGGCYAAKGRMWCSEFVSWVFFKAGKPFSGGRENQPWMLTNTEKIRDWYRKNGKFIDRTSSEWKSFRPAPGDYVFLGRAKKGGGFTERTHSGLVEFVDSNGTLNTIEGNNKGQEVGRFQYPNYIENLTQNGPANGIVLGFGRREW